MNQKRPSTTTAKQNVQPVVLVLTRGSRLSVAARKYSLNVAGRLGHSVLVAYVNTLPFLQHTSHHREQFARSVEHDVSVFLAQGKDRDIPIAYVKESGKMGKVVSRLCRILKKIDFILVDDGVCIEEVVARSQVPVFTVDKPLRARQFQHDERKNSTRQNALRRML